MEELAIICDIDNCFTDSREWIATTPETDDREEWDNVIKRCKDMVLPNYPFIKCMSKISSQLTFLFMTGREDRLNHREVTLEQIKEFSKGKFIFDGEEKNSILMMRKEFDYRSSDVVKAEMLKEVVSLGFIPILAIDDDEKNCKMFCDNGIVSMLYKIEDGDPTEDVLSCAKELLKLFKSPVS